MIRAAKIKESLYFYNPWWRDNSVPGELKLDYKRPLLKKLLSYLDLERIIVLKGPRRTGKSTLLYQLADALIEQGVAPKQILFLSFDDIDARYEISEIIKAYEEICGERIKDQPVYFLLDEIQFLENWSFQLKKYFDRKFPIKFIVSGSSASLIKQGAESLAGRTVEEIVLPFSFREYLSFESKGKLPNTISFDLSRPALPDISPLIPYQQDLLLLFNKYLKKGGFPSIFRVNEEVVWQKLLKEDIVQKVIYRDLVEYYGVKKPSTLENLFLYLAEHSSEILNASSISNSLNLSRPYVEKYLNYLKQAFLIYTLKKYSRSVAKRVRSNEKAHLIDCGLISCFGSGNEDRKLESVVGRHLWGRALFYWRERLEVDFVLDGKPPLPVEVKNKTVLDAADFKGLLSFMNKFKVNTGLLISKEELKEVKIGERKIYCLPAWLFCLIE